MESTSTTCIDESTTSDSISTSPSTMTVLVPSPEKLSRIGSGSSVIQDSEIGVEAESRKLPSSQYKGVVPQPNGRWGAQIYEKHQRVWLGTFNEEEEAAKAYDIAAQRFRGRDAIINFKAAALLVLDTEEVDIETAFLNSHSKAEIVDMLRKHTYNDELEQSKRNFAGNKTCKGVVGDFMCLARSGQATKAREHLFDKAVTPSDVGKLNRLVIPKQHAEKHFPLQIGTAPKGLLLNFEDNEGKVWRFRYSYWNSSQSYVLTKGWSRFVKEKNLKAGDIVSFLRSTGEDKQLFIEWKPRNGSISMVLEQPAIYQNKNPIQMVRLFGVNIFKMPVNIEMVDGKSWINRGNNNNNNNNKRMRDHVEVDSNQSCFKKQHIVGTYL